MVEIDEGMLMNYVNRARPRFCKSAEVYLNGNRVTKKWTGNGWP